MATLAIQIVTEEIEKVKKIDDIRKCHTENVSEALVALSSENGDSLTKEYSADSEILSLKSNSDISDITVEKEKEKININTHLQSESILQEENVTIENKDKQPSENVQTNSFSTNLICTLISEKSESVIEKLNNINIISNSNFTLEKSEDINIEDKKLHLSDSNSKSTTKIGQPAVDYLNNENSSISSLNSLITQTTNKSSENDITFKMDLDVNAKDNILDSPINSTLITKNNEFTVDETDNERLDSKSLSNKSALEQDKNEKNEKKKYFSIIDSDSEDEIILPYKFKKNVSHDESSSMTSDKKIKINKNKRKVIDSDSEEDSNETYGSDIEKNNGHEKDDFESSNMSHKISKIIDSDSESDDNNKSKGSVTSDEESKTEKPNKEKKKLEKKRTGSARASKDKAMQEIYSETQRLIRESDLSLPYHRPKQRTLQEFLNRKKVNSSIPKNLTSAEKVKMFPEVISKVIEEKEKEAEMFYKSSDSEEDESNESKVNQTDAKTKIENEIYNVNENEISNIIDTQKLTQDHIQESHNKREILIQRSLDFGVPKKLFMEDVNETEKENSQILQECFNKEENLDSDIMVMKNKNKEVKLGIREASIPRKLFTTDKEIDMDIDTNDNDVSMSEEKIEENQKVKSDNENKEIIEKKNKCENSIEEIVLNMTETEPNINVVSVENEDEENITITETPFISNKEFIKSNDLLVPQSSDNSSITKANNENETEKTDLLLKLANKTNHDEILDPNMFRDDFGLPPEFEEPIIKSTIKEKLISDALKNTPTIKASPGSMIDLTNSGQIKQGVTRLLDRFKRHSLVQKQTQDEITEVKILRTEGSGNDIQVIEEILPFKKTIEDDPTKESKPGEKLKKLKEDLKRKIATVRNEEWKQKEQEEEEEDEDEETKSKGDDFYKDLPDEEEILESEMSAESEPEEDDMPIIENRKRKICEFGDEEAEESFDENNENDEEEEENEEDDEEDEDEEDEENEEENEADEENEDHESEKEEETYKKKKKLKRIIKPFDEDSNQSDSSKNNEEKTKSLSNQAKANEDIFSSQNGYGSDENDAIPPFQPRERCDSDSRSQACKTPLPKANNILSMISPVIHLTALNTSLDSAKKSASKTNNLNFEQIDDTLYAENTPEFSDRIQNNSNLKKMIGLQKKLFDDPPETVNDAELLEICSGRFTDTQNSKQSINNTSNGVTDSQLMNLSSGTFSSQPIDIKKLESNESNLQAVQDDSSQDIILTLDDDENFKSSPLKSSTSIKKSDESMFSNDSKSPVKLPSFGEGTFKNPMDTWLKKVNEKPADPSQSEQKTNEVTDSQLMNLCSGSFTSQPIGMKELQKSQTQRTAFKNPMDAWLSKANKNSIDQLQRKSDEVSASQLMDICSGSFTSQPMNIEELEKNEVHKSSLKNPMDAWITKAANQNQQKAQEVTDSELMELCSGSFSTQQVDTNKVEKSQMLEIQNETSQDFKLTLEKSSSFKENKKQTDNSKPSNQQIVTEEESEKPWTGFAIVSSSDDEDRSKKVRRKKKFLKKKKVKTLTLSDDEDEEKEFSVDEESEIETEEDEEKYVDYDSEENEVIVVPKKDIKKVATKFLENEAELSESDWGSADENEEDLDNFEYEEGDAEDIDESKVKDQLDKIHMKQVMDEDQREVKMLQELLFDDGDLHSEGAGRERKFKWKNIDNLGDDNLEPQTDDNNDEIDDEVDSTVELQIRKMRYERQKFLEGNEKSAIKNIDDDFTKSQSFKLKVVSMRSSTKNSIEEEKLLPKSNSDGIVINSKTSFVSKKLSTNSKSFSFTNMRGSFLARGDATLVRIAQNLPETSKAALKTGRKGHFVFEHLSPSVSNAKQEDSGQENDNTPAKETKNKSRKRKMFASQSQTPKTTKKTKMDDRAPGKKLF